MKDEKGDLYVFAVIITILSVAGLIISIFTLTNNPVAILSFMISLLITIFVLAILWTINGISKKLNNLVDLLEEKKTISSKDARILEGFDLDGAGKVEDSDLEVNEDISYCKNCGYQLFIEDKECPICHTPKSTTRKKNK